MQKLRHYCAYTERCHSDVVSKLYDLGVWKKEHDEIVAALIEENYLNEERFAKSFTGGILEANSGVKIKLYRP
ncbi:RecX family transcriptional regulator [Niabella sp. W65]|nr:RecX family transcriptional regulator [Niabella sp. W65]MCH7368966.1 RecX family transcriptional regulator [Niabella sp. W65]